MIREFMKFWLAACAVVFAMFIATSYVYADNIPGHPNTGYWLTIIDFDAAGQGSIEQGMGPRKFDDDATCQRLGKQLVLYINTYEPERSFVAACLHPEFETDASLDEVINAVMQHFGPYFRSPTA